jgi:hypothetical protein
MCYTNASYIKCQCDDNQKAVTAHPAQFAWEVFPVPAAKDLHAGMNHSMGIFAGDDSIGAFVRHEQSPIV